ncbi:hypothetical protein OIU79_013867 [Salix purpurea]|uniref:Protein kinase domain-containing protein n=1 Tax=Salix purpurea TaxID=77065 RepID=A0A9Q0PQ15_SALPP|nr:hypothetical protein OIU79_013867 [Salix purpurea]
MDKGKEPVARARERLIGGKMLARSSAFRPVSRKVPSYDYLSKSGYSSPQELGRTKKANRPKPESRVLLAQGEGASARLFRGSLPSGLAVAVKRVNRSSEIEYSRRNPFTTEFATVPRQNPPQEFQFSELPHVEAKLYGQAWLGDFGLAEVYEHSSNTREVTIPPAGRMGYLAPEYVYSAVPTEKTYVYSFGVVVLEVATGRRPVDDDGLEN